MITDNKIFDFHFCIDYNFKDIRIYVLFFTMKFMPHIRRFYNVRA